MTRILLIGAGGFIGTILRYLAAGWVYKFLDSPWFPYGTLAVNTVGCFVIGFLAGLAESRMLFGPETRLFLFLGILGGFTTYSTYAYETYFLLRDAQTAGALTNIGLQTILGLFGVWLGHSLARLM